MLVVALDAVLHGDVADQAFGLKTADHLQQFLLQLNALDLWDELCGVHCVHQKLDLRHGKRAVLDPVTFLSSKVLFNIDAKGPESRYIARNRLPMGFYTPAL